MWIANLCDGETITEREVHWDDLPLGEVSCLQLVHESGRTAFIRKREGYQFFQFKSKASIYDPNSGKIFTTPMLWQRIGAVVNEKGDCIYVEMDPKSGFFDFRYDNVISMRLNLPHLRIKIPEEVIQERKKVEEDKKILAYLNWLEDLYGKQKNPS